jgi:hypothetical protein
MRGLEDEKRPMLECWDEKRMLEYWNIKKRAQCKSCIIIPFQ